MPPRSQSTPRTPLRSVRHRTLLVPAALGAALITAPTLALAGQSGSSTGTSRVGDLGPGRTLTPAGQVVTPAGQTVRLPGKALATAVSPDGKTAVSLSWENFAGYLTVTDLVGHRVLQTTAQNLGSGDVSFNGLLFSRDGRTLWAAQSADLLRFAVNPDGTLQAPTVIALPTGAQGAVALPSGLAWNADGTELLATFNGLNTLAVINPVTGTVLAQIPTGNAPRDVVVHGSRAYVTNQGGRPATASDFTNPSYTTPLVADTTDGRATTGTVTVIDLIQRAAVAQIPVGLQPTAALVDGADVLVTNTADDTVSVIDTATNAVVQTFSANPIAAVGGRGVSPNALARIDSTHVAVTLGAANAVAVVQFAGGSAPARLQGLIPTGWYPVSVANDPALGQLVVGSAKGVGSLGPVASQSYGPGSGTPTVTGHTVYAHVGTIQTVPAPDNATLARDTSAVFANNQWTGLAQRNQPGSGHAAPVAVPVHLGDPSKIKHVFVIVKENRTYDQVLGDDHRGNGDPSLAQFGQQVTPNLHALARTFPLLDNTYSAGTLSADGHNWVTQATANDYVEREFGAFVRSYPASGADALAYQKTGFLWDAAARAGLTARSWGEYGNFFSGPNNVQPQGTWSQWYHDSQILEGKASGSLHAPVGYYQTHSDVPSLERILAHSYPNFQLQIPDQYRADLFLRDFAGLEKRRALPALNLLWVMTDHTHGLSSGYPVPKAEVADNDLAVGRIVDAISHSKDWKSTAVFVLEDDSQDGVDHVDGHRAPVFVASPFARRGAVVDTYYTQVNVVRTIEQILGLAPMNSFDLTATPMFDVFTNKPDNRPFSALSAQVPLDTFPAGTPAGAQVATAASPNAVQQAWMAWSAAQNFSGPDRVSASRLNRLVWYSSYGFHRPFPGDTAVLLPSQVPAGNTSDN